MKNFIIEVPAYTKFLIGNIFSLFSSFFLIIGVFSPIKEKMIQLQITDAGLALIANLFLGGISGAVVNLFAVVRNILVYKNKINTMLTSSLIVIMSTIIISFNNKGLIGYLPLLATVSYTLILCNKKSSLLLIKKMLLLNQLLWMGYNGFIMSIPAFLTNFILAILTFIAIIKETNKNAQKIDKCMIKD